MNYDKTPMPDGEESDYSIGNIIITEEGYPVSEREIEIGDHFIDVLKMYPDEKPDNPRHMYEESPAGTRIQIRYDDSENVETINLVDGFEEEGYVPFGIDLHVEDGYIVEIEYYFAGM